jgi:hypothetical protein
MTKLDSSRQPSVNEAERLADELSQLSRQQWEALKTWMFLGVREQEFQMFAKRRKRIGELAESNGAMIIRATNSAGIRPLSFQNYEIVERNK